MSIKPVDFQMLIPKTMEVSKISSDEAQRNAALVQQQAALTQHRAESSLKQVYAREKPHDVRITEKQKEEGKEERDREKKKKDKDGKKILNNGIQTSTIDIKI